MGKNPRSAKIAHREAILRSADHLLKWLHCEASVPKTLDCKVPISGKIVVLRKSVCEAGIQTLSSENCPLESLFCESL